MIEIGSFEARTHFSDLLRRVSHGEEFVVTMRGKPIARLLSAEDKSAPDKLDVLLSKLSAFRSEIAQRGLVLASGETFKDWARDGRKW
ncbi:MAG: type II toxin-antitoxin system prevent-host-death family antitoxin [Prosthecobacter sp.]|nr:type II toxin-antitoxin system prevent-host-death family antitoxin [Prosthecobacter sp.]